MLKFVDYKDLNQAKSIESLAEFKTLHSLPDSKPIAIVNKSCRMIYVNNSFFEIFGIKENSSISETDTVPDLERTVIGLFQSHFSNLNMEVFLPNDNFRTLMLDAERVIISNEEYILLIFNTVQQKITLEGRINTLHQALEYSDIPVLITDAGGKITYATASFEKILDLSLDVIYNNSLSSVFSMHLGQDDISEWKKQLGKIRNGAVRFLLKTT